MGENNELTPILHWLSKIKRSKPTNPLQPKPATSEAKIIRGVESVTKTDNTPKYMLRDIYGSPITETVKLGEEKWVPGIKSGEGRFAREETTETLFFTGDKIPEIGSVFTVGSRKFMVTKPNAKGDSKLFGGNSVFVEPVPLDESVVPQV